MQHIARQLPNTERRSRKIGQTEVQHPMLPGIFQKRTRINQKNSSVIAFRGMVNKSAGEPVTTSKDPVKNIWTRTGTGFPIKVPNVWNEMPKQANWWKCGQCERRSPAEEGFRTVSQWLSQTKSLPQDRLPIWHSTVGQGKFEMMVLVFQAIICNDSSNFSEKHIRKYCNVTLNDSVHSWWIGFNV